MPDHILSGSFLCWTIVHAHNSVLILHHTNGQRGFTTNREKGHRIAMMSWGETRGSAVSGWTTSHNCLNQTGQRWHSLFTSGKIIKVCWSGLGFMYSWCGLCGFDLPTVLSYPQKKPSALAISKTGVGGHSLIHFSTETGKQVVKRNTQMNCSTSKLWRQLTPPKELQRTGRRS